MNVVGTNAEVCCFCRNKSERIKYYDEDESYGHSVEDNYCVSPGTAAQFTFNREKDVALSHYMDEQGGIPEEDEPEEGEETLHGSHDYTRPTLSSIDEARLNSCLEDVRNVLGESVPDSMMLKKPQSHNGSRDKTGETDHKSKGLSLNDLAQAHQRMSPVAQISECSAKPSEGTPSKQASLEDLAKAHQDLAKAHGVDKGPSGGKTKSVTIDRQPLSHTGSLLSGDIFKNKSDKAQMMLSLSNLVQKHAAKTEDKRTGEIVLTKQSSNRGSFEQKMSIDKLGSQTSSGLSLADLVKNKQMTSKASVDQNKKSQENKSEKNVEHAEQTDNGNVENLKDKHGSSDNSAPAKPQLELDFPTEPPTVILKEPRKPLTSVPQPKIIEPYLSQPTVVKSMSPQRTPKGKNRTAELAPLAAKAKNDNKVALTKDAKAVSSESKDKRTDTLDVEKSASSEKIENKDQLATPKKERFIPPLPRSSSKSKYEKYDLKEEYKKRQGGKDMLNMVVIGHVDAGKSTLMGHVLYQLGSVNQRVMHKYEQESKKLGKSSFAYAWVLDETEEERARGVTMDIAQTKFETPHKIITLLDAPGHKDFIPNMITGTAQADVAILVVNATKGEFETGFESGGQTREHALLARSLGVHQLIVAVNKMDTVGWDPARYDDIVRKLGLFLKQAGFREGDTNFVPVSGLGGENLAKPIKEPKLAAWYKGLNLLEQIDKFKPVPRAVDRPVRIMVSDVFKGQQGSGLTAAGKVVSGSVQIGDRLAVMPAAEYCIVKSITNNEEAVNFAFSGDHVIVGVAGIDITNIVVIFHYQTVTEPAIVKKLVSHLNKSTGEVIKNKPKCLMKNSSAVVEIEFEFPLCVELYKDNKEMGRFMLRSGGHTIAAGLIEEVLKTKAGEGVKKGGEGAESQGAMGN
ncbi:HBS1L-like protein [Mya arenaria]|uniref:HBS1L-like protein n=1 Tax=Mya arenaria TaxID=6604 RepID=A0ABY7FVP4_MYAAR|nr:HBS1L-like protein [Mya arenaria]